MARAPGFILRFKQSGARFVGPHLILIMDGLITRKDRLDWMTAPDEVKWEGSGVDIGDAFVVQH